MIKNWEEKYKSNIDKSQINSINNSYMLGILANDYDKLPFIGEDNKSITVMKKSYNIVSYLKVISEECDFIKEELNEHILCNDIYINVDIHNKGKFIYNESYFSKSNLEKCEQNKKLFKDKIIVFKPKISITADKIHKNINLIQMIDVNNIDIYSKYIQIPIIKGSYDEFEKNLFKQNYIVINDDIMTTSSNEYIICENKFYGVFDHWYKSYSFRNGWMCEGKENVSKINIDILDSEFKENCIIVNNESAFINKSYLTMLDERLINEGDILDFTRFEDLELNKEKYLECENKILVDESISSKDIFLKSDIKTESQYLIKNTEIMFLKNFKNITEQKGLNYSLEDLINFHISIKTNSLTIVAGMTGTGKTQIAKCYAEALGLTFEDEDILFLPISPSYMEPQDLLGYLNITTGIYSPTETGLVDILVKAFKNKNKMFMVIFDEMNLSQIEHWFAPFLSLLELDESERNFKLYGKDQICYNSVNYPNSIKILNNVIFIGTVNLDETVKDFSDRVLDRANIITLQRSSFSKLYNENLNKNLKENQSEKSIIEKISNEKFSEWINKSYGLNGLTEDEVKFIDNLNDFLLKEDCQKGITFRFINKLSYFLNNIPKSKEKSLITRSKAFDLVIKQRLLTKLRGSERQLRGLIEVNYDDCDANSPIYDFFNSDDAKNISDFEITKIAIKNKEKELGKYGYTN